MNRKGARIRHLEIQVARLTAELDDVRRDVAMFKPIAPKPSRIDLPGGLLGGTTSITVDDNPQWTYTNGPVGGIVKDGTLYLVNETAPKRFDPPPVPA